jgi:hypothetical protein
MRWSMGLLVCAASKYCDLCQLATGNSSLARRRMSRATKKTSRMRLRNNRLLPQLTQSQFLKL